MKHTGTKPSPQELLPLPCGQCLACPFCLARAVLLWVLLSGKITTRTEWKRVHTRARSKTETDLSGIPGGFPWPVRWMEPDELALVYAEPGKGAA
jgi:hypothetical protein